MNKLSVIIIAKNESINIYNCVRANNNKILGFLKDLRRLNVAITRPKHFLFVVGAIIAHCLVFGSFRMVHLMEAIEAICFLFRQIN